MMSQKNLNSRCNARAKSGKPCGAAATPGGLCFFHANSKKASELGRIGGRSNRHAAGENVQLRAIETTDVERRLAKLEKLSAEAENRPEPTASPPPTAIKEKLHAATERIRHEIMLKQSRALAGVSSSSDQPGDSW
jgi:hypothetical protein